MFIVGLTGGIGSGKSTVAALFAEKGIAVIDTDQLSRDVTTPGKSALAKIAAYFGPSILDGEGKLNRGRLRTIIFSDENKRKWLEQLLHPLIIDEMHRFAEKSSSPYVIAMIPLLFETESIPLIDRILVIDTSEDQQILRTQKRDNLTAEEVKSIISTQIIRNERLQKAHDVIFNDGKIEDLIPQVNKFHELYLRLAHCR